MSINGAIRGAEQDEVDEASEESFPCSDPPPWTTGATPAEPRPVKNDEPNSEPASG